MKQVRKIGTQVLCTVWNFLCNVVEFLAAVYGVALGIRTKRTSLKTRIVCCISAIAMTLGAIARLFAGSMIWTGIKYFIYSMEKRLAIMWASEGDWNHWMTLSRYTVFGDLKSELIANDKFASFLSNLANYGFFGKVLQIALIIICLASALLLVMIIFKCMHHLVWCIKKIYRNKMKAKLMDEAENENIIDFEDACNRRNHRVS